MKITTETGSVYDIKHGICKKTDVDGNWIDTFKVYVIKPITVSDEDIKTWDDLHSLTSGEPEIGKRLYISGRDVSWISTRVISIEESEYDE